MNTILIFIQLCLIIVIYNTHKDNMRRIQLDEKENHINELHTKLYEYLENPKNPYITVRKDLLIHIYYVSEINLQVIEKYMNKIMKDEIDKNDFVDKMAKIIIDERIMIWQEKNKLANEIHTRLWNWISKTRFWEWISNTRIYKWIYNKLFNTRE